MAKDFSISINYRNRKTAGKKRSVTDIQRQVRSAKSASLNQGSISNGLNKKSDPMSMRNSNSFFKELVKTNRELIKEIRKNTDSNKKHPGGKDEGKDGAGAGVGRIGSTIPLVGAIVAAAGFTISQINKVGRSFLERSRAQSTTAGVGGFQRYGDLKSGYFDASQMGDFVKSRRTSSGKFNTGGSMGRDNSRAAISYARLFGIGANEAGTTLGTFEKAGQASDFTKVLGQAEGSGFQTEMPLFINRITDELKDAVKEGVNASSLAKEMGAQIAYFSKYTDSKSKEHLISMVKNLSDLQSQTAKGSYESFDQRNMLMSARLEVRSRLKNKDKDLLSYLENNSDLSKDEINRSVKSGRVDYVTENKLSTRLLEQKDTGVRSRFLGNTMQRATGGLNNKDSYKNAWVFLNKHGSYLANNTQNFDTLMKAYNQSGGDMSKFLKEANTKGTDLNSVVKNMDSQAEKEGGASAFSAGRTEFKREIMALSQVAGEAAKSVQLFEDALFKTAKSMEGGVMGTINKIKSLLKDDNRSHKQKADAMFKKGYLSPVEQAKLGYHYLNGLWEK